jgi:peptidoglycan/LPS O-acetylase OafA/YrhL
MKWALKNTKALSVLEKGLQMKTVLFNKYKSNYRPDIDGVRAVAILSVVLYHSGLPLISGGFTGVDIFFVISGYLIGGHIFSELCSGTFSFLSFYKRRAKRILPAFYFMMVFAFLSALVLLSPLEAYKFAKWAIASMLSVSNIFFSQGLPYFAASSEFNPLLMTWSLGVEEQFYAVIPLGVILFTRKRRGLLLPAILFISVLSFVFACYELNNNPSRAFFSLLSRAWELGAGVLLATFELSRKRKLIPVRWIQAIGTVGLALMLVPIFLFTAATPFPGFAAVPTVLGTVMVIAASNCWINRWLLSFAPLVFIGRISYSWYLWHWPLLAFLRITAAGKLPHSVIVFSIVASFAAAVFSYYIVEQPFRRSSRASGPLLMRYATVSLAFVGVFSILYISHGFPKRYPVLSQNEAKIITDLQVPCMADYDVGKPDLSSRCYSISDLRPSVVLWGDSHSGVLAEVLRQDANSQGYNFIQMSKSACLPLKDAAIFDRKHPLLASKCIDFNNEVLNLIAADRRIRIVIMAGHWEAPFIVGTENQLIPDLAYEQEIPPEESARRTFIGSLSASIQSLQRDGKRVIVFDDVPNFDFDPLSRFRTANIPARHMMAVSFRLDTGDRGVSTPGFVSASSISSDLLDQIHKRISGVELINLKSMLCNSQNLCVYMDDNRLLYRDGVHLTATGARYALRNFRFPPSSL